MGLWRSLQQPAPPAGFLAGHPLSRASSASSAPWRHPALLCAVETQCASCEPSTAAWRAWRVLARGCRVRQRNLVRGRRGGLKPHNLELSKMQSIYDSLSRKPPPPTAPHKRQRSQTLTGAPPQPRPTHCIIAQIDIHRPALRMHAACDNFSLTRIRSLAATRRSRRYLYVLVVELAPKESQRVPVL